MARLDLALLRKMARKSKRTEQGVRVSIAKFGARNDMVSEAAQVILAQRMRIGAGSAFRRLSAHHQQQVREHRAVRPERSPAKPAPASRRTAERRASDGIRDAINVLITDGELRDRCADILRGSRKYDRAVNQATLVLEDRLRKRGGITEKLIGQALVAKVLHKNNIHLQVSPDPEIQDGYFSICKGLAAVYRNPTHHHPGESTREDALAVCALINVILKAVDAGRRVVPLAKPASP